MKNFIGWFFILLIGFNYSNAQPGQLDPSFGNGGKILIQNLNDNRPGGQKGMAIQPDGKIILGGTTYNNNNAATRGRDFMVLRLLPDGKLDSSFGMNGSVVMDNDIIFGPEEYFEDVVLDIALQTDGKIVFLGSSHHPWNGGYTVVVRLDPDGSIDSSFHGDGIKTTNLGSGAAMSILPGGEILIAGSGTWRTASGPNTDIAVMKWLPDGQPDVSFGTNGLTYIDLGQNESANTLAVQGDGKIILGGRTITLPDHQNDFLVGRLMSNGKVDPTFSEDGFQQFDWNAQYEWVNSIAIQQDQKIVITGHHQVDFSTGNRILVARINQDGSFDYSFDFNGIKLIETGYAREFAEVVLVDQRNNILIGGAAQEVQFGDDDFAVYRLTPEGNFDNRFDGDGRVYVKFGKSSHLSSMKFQADGKLVLGGTSSMPGPDLSIAVARLQYESNPDVTSKSTYIGPEILGTPCYGCQTAIIPLRATVTTNKADVRNTRVKFVDRDNNTDITGWIPASKLVDPNDFSLATVDATWYYTLSYAQPVKKVIVGMMVDFGDSIRNESSDNTTITLYMPQNDVVSGGGELFVSATSKGKYKANEGSVTMFGFYAQSKPGMAQPDGYMNMWFSGRNESGNTVTYKLEINSINGLGVNNSTLSANKAEFHGTGKLWQETGSGRMLVENNVMVQTKLVDGDNIQPTEDSLTVYIWSSNNVLIHTSNWFLTKAVPQPLWRGQVNVHSGNSFEEHSTEVITQRAAGSAIERRTEADFNVKILNNPTWNEFSLNVTGSASTLYSIRVSDISGRLIEFRDKVPVGSVLKLGSGFKRGMYVAEIRQGKQVRTVKLIKN